MNKRYALPLAIVSLTCLWTPAAPTTAQTQEPPKVQIPKAGVSADHDDGRQVRPRRLQQRRLRYPRLPDRQLFGRRRVGAPRSRDDGARQRVGLPVDPRRAVARDAGWQDAPVADDHEHREVNTSAIEQRAKVQSDSINYFPPQRAPAVRASCSFPTWTSRALPRDDVELSTAPRLCRPALFQDPWRHRLRPALAQREVREEPRAGAVPDPDQGGREDASPRTTGTSRSRSRRHSSRRRSSWRRECEA